jgi:sigma-B regulation protein RsbQ
MSSVQRNNVKISGNGSKTLMFAHGYGCDQNMWRGVAPSFEKDFKVVLFDYVGSGDSDPSAFNRTRYSTLNGYAADVIEIIDELKLENVNFAGHSVSSMIGALAAIKRPELFESLRGPRKLQLPNPRDHLQRQPHRRSCVGPASP